MFIAGLILLGLVAALIAAAPLWRAGRRAQGAIAGVLVAGTAAGIYLAIGAPTLGLDPPRPQAAEPPQDVGAMVEQLAERLEAQPDDPEGWTMLGRAYVLMGRYADAARAFREAQTRSPGENPDLMASYAEARALADPAVLEGEIGAVFERVLELDPENPRGLWYGGLAAEARGDTERALARFRKLLARELPAEFRQVVEARAAAIDAGAVGALITATVDVAPELAGQVPAGAVLYVFLRGADDPGQGPPLAARRVAYFEFPVTVPVTRADLLRGDALPDGPLVVSARLSADGDPAPGPGDLEGSVTWSPGDSHGVHVILDRRAAE